MFDAVSTVSECLDGACCSATFDDLVFLRDVTVKQVFSSPGATSYTKFNTYLTHTAFPLHSGRNMISRYVKVDT